MTRSEKLFALAFYTLTPAYMLLAYFTERLDCLMLSASVALIHCALRDIVIRGKEIASWRTEDLLGEYRITSDGQQAMIEKQQAMIDELEGELRNYR